MPDTDGGTDGSDTDSTSDRTATNSIPSSTYKVLGEFSATDGAGVLGHNTATSGSPIGTEGVVETNTGAGVRGTNTANADTVNDVFPKGVRGKTTGTGPTFAVFGRGSSPGAQGVVGEATESEGFNLSDGYPAGVRGVTDRSGADSDVAEAYGTIGAHMASSGSGMGILGFTFSPASDAYGVVSAGNSRTEGNHEVTGDLSVGAKIERDIGAKVALSSSQTIDHDSDTTVAFENVLVDDRSEFDGTNNEFVCATDGSYRVTVQLLWDDSIPGDTGGNYYINAKILEDGGVRGYDRKYVAVPGFHNHNFSATLRDVTAGAKISVELYQNMDGSSYDLSANSAWTNLTVTYLGT